MAGLSPHPVGIPEPYRVITNIPIGIDTIYHATGVAADPPRQPRRVVAGPVVIETALIVALLAGEAVALLREGPKAGLAVGCVLLAVDPRTGAVYDHVAAAEMVAQVVFHHWGSIVRERLADAHLRDPALIVHHVQRVVLLDRARFDDTLMLKYTIDVDRHFDLSALAHQLLHPLASRVVEVVGVDCGLRIPYLGAEDSHPARVVPLVVT